MNYEDRKKLNDELKLKIQDAKQLSDHKPLKNLQIQYHENRAEMLKMIDSEDKARAMMSARQLRDLVRSRPPIPRYATGITKLDFELRDGFEVANYVQLVAESGAGKTSLVYAIIANIASYNRAVVFNFEMGDRKVIDRLERLLKTEAQWDNFQIDSVTRNIDELCEEILIEARDGVKFFVIDSMMKIEHNTDNKFEKEEYISNRLSKLAQEREIIILLINQMSEDAQKNKRLSIKGNNAQKYDADITLFITVESEHSRKMYCTKNRQDEVLFNFEYTLADLDSTIREQEIEFNPSSMTKF